MRKLLLLLLLPCCVTAQHEWEQMLMDSVPFHNMFGTEKEFQIQSANQLCSTNKRRVCFIGYKWGYTNNFAEFLKERNWDVTNNSGYHFFTFTCNKKDTSNAQLFITFYTNDEDRITTVIAIGTKNDDVINLYKDFWESPDISSIDLKAKHKMSFNSGTDKVSLRWIKHKPVIRVTNTGYATFGETSF